MQHTYFGQKKRNNDTELKLVTNEPVQFAPNMQTMESDSCRIFFYKDVDDESICSLIALLREKAANSVKVQYQFELAEPPPVHLHIQSYGGLVFSGFSGLEHIRNSKVPIYTYVDGMAASAATFLSVVGAKRFMYKESSILIHQLSSGFWGKYDELIDEKKNCDLLMEKIKRIYLQYTKFDTKQLNSLLKRDLYLSAEECLKYGLVDEII